MPTLPLPPLSDGVPIDGGDLPVSSSTDVANEWALEIQEVQTDPIRDAIQCGQTDMFLEYQRASSYAAAQSDPGRATDEYLDEILEEYGCPRQTGQGDEDARAVMFATPPVISPVAVLAVTNAILAPYTVVPCRYAERSDGWFAGLGTSPWSSHIFATKDNGDDNATPNYPDRPVNPQRRPPGAMPNADTYGRWFLLRAPDISSINSELAAIFNGSQNEPTSGVETTASVGGFYVGSGTNVNDDNDTFIFNFTATTVDDVYNQLIGAVDNAIGFGIRWDLNVEPNLGV
jgi:hypothetical protein